STLMTIEPWLLPSKVLIHFIRPPPAAHSSKRRGGSAKWITWRAPWLRLLCVHGDVVDERARHPPRVGWHTMNSARSAGIAEHHRRTGLARFGGLQAQIRVCLI